jgi:hypothetical protein
VLPSDSLTCHSECLKSLKSISYLKTAVQSVDGRGREVASVYILMQGWLHVSGDFLPCKGRLVDLIPGLCLHESLTLWPLIPPRSGSQLYSRPFSAIWYCASIAPFITPPRTFPASRNSALMGAIKATGGCFLQVWQIRREMFAFSLLILAYLTPLSVTQTI